jgi:hypothetical protein
MAIVEREFSSIEEGGLCVSVIVYDDADGRIQSCIMRGNMNERSVLTLIGAAGTRSDGLKNQPEIVMDLLPENVFMVNEAGVWKTPPGLERASDNYDLAVDPAEVTRRRGTLKPTDPVITPRTRTP